MSSHTEFQLHIMFYTSDIDPTAPNTKTRTVTTKSLFRDNKLVCLLVSDIELLSPKLKLNIHLTKSHKCNYIYKLCL